MANSRNQSGASSTPGGIVSLQSIIEQISAITEGLEAVVDSVLGSTHSAIMSIKVKMAKKRLRNATKQLNDLVHTIEECLTEIVDNIDIQQLNDKLNTVIGDNASLTKLLNANNDPTLILKGVNNNVGILGIVIGLMAVINLIGTFDIPNPIKMRVQMKRLQMSLSVVLNTLPDILKAVQSANESIDIEELQKTLQKIITLMGLIYEMSNTDIPNPLVMIIKMLCLKLSLEIMAQMLPSIATSLNAAQNAINSMNYDDSMFEIIDDICSAITAIARRIAILALITPLIAIAAPIAVLGVLIMSATIRALIWCLGILGSPATIRQANIAMRNVRRLLRHILRAIRYIAATIAIITAIIVICCLIGMILPKVFGAFILGLITIMVMMGVLVVMLKLMAKFAGNAARASRAVLLRMLLVCAVLVVLALVMLVLALIAEVVNGKMNDIIMLMVMLMGVILVMVALMAVAGFASSFLAAGTAALALVMVGILMVVLMVGLLLLLTIIAEYLNPDAVKAAVGKVIDCVVAVVQAIMEADFKGSSNQEQDGGLIGMLLGFIGGGLLSGIFNLFLKVVILFLALFALGIILGLVSLMLIIYDLYTNNQAKLNATPKVIANVVNICGRVIQSLLNAKTSAKFSTDDGIFLALVGLVYGQDMVSIFKLLFKIVIVMLTIVVLAMIKFLCEELLWIKKFYDANKTDLNAVPGIIEEIVGICSNVIQTIINANTGFKSEEFDGIFLALVGFVYGQDVVSIFKLLFKIVIIALTIVVLAMLKCVMDELQWIANTYNEMGGAAMGQRVVEMVDNIVGAVTSIISIISQAGNEPDGKPRSGLSKLLKWLGLGDLATVVDLLCGFAMIGLSIFALAVVLGAAKMIQACWEVYTEMGGANIGKNAYNMTKGLGDAINNIIKGLAEIKIDVPEGVETPWWADAASAIFGKWVNNVARLMSVTGALANATPVLAGLVAVTKTIKMSSKDISKGTKLSTNIATQINELTGNIKETVDALNNANIGQVEKLDGNLQRIEDTINKISSTFNRLLGDDNNAVLSEVIKKEATYAKVVADTDKLINRINGMDIAKVSALAKMFGNAAAFSNSINGNFDKLADVINEKIAPLIKALTDAIEEADRHIQESSKKAEEARQAAENAKKAADDARNEAKQVNNDNKPTQATPAKQGSNAQTNKPTPTTPAKSNDNSNTPKVRKDESIGDYINRVGYLPVKIK